MSTSRAPEVVLQAVAARSRRLAEQFHAASRARPERPRSAPAGGRRPWPVLHWVMLSMSVLAAIRQLQAG